MLPGSGMGAALDHSRDSLLDTKLSFVTVVVCLVSFLKLLPK